MECDHRVEQIEHEQSHLTLHMGHENEFKISKGTAKRRSILRWSEILRRQYKNLKVIRKTDISSDIIHSTSFRFLDCYYEYNCSR